MDKLYFPSKREHYRHRRSVQEIRWRKMDRDTRLRAFMEEYARAVAMVDDVAWIRQSLQRIELLIAIITAQLGAALLVAVLFFICNFLCCDGCGPSIYRGSNLQSSNVIERDGKQMRSSSKPELVA